MSGIANGYGYPDAYHDPTISRYALAGTPMPEHRLNISDLVQGFAKHIKAYKSKETNEAVIRQQFIDPFWRALGWDVGNSKQVGPDKVEVIIEKSVETAEAGGLRCRRPDYLFRLGGFPRLIVEAKKPAVDIDVDRDAVFQAKQYAWNSTIPFAVLTNFEQFRLYDTTLKPIHSDPRRGLIREYSLDYDGYESQWDVLTQIFGRSSVENGSLERVMHLNASGSRNRVHEQETLPERCHG